MNIKLLRKLRKRYKWYWDTEPDFDPIFWVLDMKKGEAIPYKGIRNFLTDFVYSHYGFGVGSSYTIRLNKREKRAEFRNKLKNISPHA
jgi:hypothetical protein